MVTVRRDAEVACTSHAERVPIILKEGILALGFQDAACVFQNIPIIFYISFCLDIVSSTVQNNHSLYICARK